MDKRKWCCALLALATMSALAENNPIVDLLNRRHYDREVILRQAPADKIQEIPAATEGPGFLPLRTPNVINIKDERPNLLALVLPTSAGGLFGRAADSFYRGCLHGVRAAGRTTNIDLYATDGTAESTYNNYMAAVNRGAQFVIGPMLKSGVRWLLEKQPQAPVPTLLLQPSDGGGYYVMTLDAGREAADLASLLHVHGVTEVRVIEQLGQRGAQQQKAFEKAWIAASGRTSGRFLVREPARDWQRLFDDLKTLADDKEKFVLFVAGNSDFARKARKFVPQRYPVYATSIVNNDKMAGSVLSEGLRFMEMPWFLDLSAKHAIFDSPQTRTLSVVRQRFFALGIDSCLMALDWPLWKEGWTTSGVSGDWRLQGGIFSRVGRLVFYQAGQLQVLTP